MIVQKPRERMFFWYWLVIVMNDGQIGLASEAEVSLSFSVIDVFMDIFTKSDLTVTVVSMHNCPPHGSTLPKRKNGKNVVSSCYFLFPLGLWQTLY